MSSDDTTNAIGDERPDPGDGPGDGTPPQIERPDPGALQQLTNRLAGLADPDPDDDSIWAPTSGRSDRSGEDGKGVETALSSPGPLPPATELDALPAAGIEAETHDAMDMGRAWIDDGAEPVDDLWDVAQSPPVRARGPIVPLEIVIPIVVLALLIVVFVSWTS